MRRWACIVYLLAGFARTDYAWTLRPRLPVPIVRPADPDMLDPREAAALLIPAAQPWTRP